MTSTLLEESLELYDQSPTSSWMRNKGAEALSLTVILHIIHDRASQLKYSRHRGRDMYVEKKH